MRSGSIARACRRPACRPPTTARCSPRGVDGIGAAPTVRTLPLSSPTVASGVSLQPQRAIVHECGVRQFRDEIGHRCVNAGGQREIARIARAAKAELDVHAGQSAPSAAGRTRILIELWISDCLSTS
jgi:hypothetical protein